jgi:hypothetical protein
MDITIVLKDVPPGIVEALNVAMQDYLKKGFPKGTIEFNIGKAICHREEASINIVLNAMKDIAIVSVYHNLTEVEKQFTDMKANGGPLRWN